MAKIHAPEIKMRDCASCRTKILREVHVLETVGIGRSTMRELIAKGQFPAPIRLGARAVGWLEHEIEAWIAARIAATRKSEH